MEGMQRIAGSAGVLSGGISHAKLSTFMAVLLQASMARGPLQGGTEQGSAERDQSSNPDVHEGARAEIEVFGQQLELLGKPAGRYAAVYSARWLQITAPPHAPSVFAKTSARVGNAVCVKI